MKYIAWLNGKKYEIEIEKVEKYVPLTQSEITGGRTTPTTVPSGSDSGQSIPLPQREKLPSGSETAASKPVSGSAVSSTAASQREKEFPVLSPMPGKILDITASEGKSVQRGEVLLIMEAMKMENEIVAPAAGIVLSVKVKKGDVVDTDTVLVMLS